MHLHVYTTYYYILLQISEEVRRQIGHSKSRGVDEQFKLLK